MTKETKITMAMDRYEDRIEEITKEYQHRFDALPVNRFGETSADAVLELNAWSIQAKNEARQQFMKEFKEADSDNSRRDD